MKCPKCGKNDSRDNFCGGCGAQLREKCQECGNMEPIGQPSCMNELKAIGEKVCEIKNKIYSSKWPERISLGVMLGYMTISATVVLMLKEDINAFFSSSSGDLLLIIFFWCMGILPVTCTEIRLRKKVNSCAELAVEKFWSENPELKVKYDVWQEWLKLQK